MYKLGTWDVSSRSSVPLWKVWLVCRSSFSSGMPRGLRRATFHFGVKIASTQLSVKGTQGGRSQKPIDGVKWQILPRDIQNGRAACTDRPALSLISRKPTWTESTVEWSNVAPDVSSLLMIDASSAATAITFLHVLDCVHAGVATHALKTEPKDLWLVFENL